MKFNRRGFVLGASAIGLWQSLVGARTARAAPEALAAAKPYSPAYGPRSRTIFLNDLSGDIDGLFAAAHQILSKSTELRGIVGTGTGKSDETAERSAELASEMLALMGMTGQVKVHTGAPGKISAPDAPVRSEGTQAIIDEAMRTDTRLPLFVAVGGGLTEVASALMLEPRIANHVTLVWIGGGYSPSGGIGETNFSIDPLAAQFVFNESNVRIWQVPRDAYATCLVSDSELNAFVAPNGAIGAWLYKKVFEKSKKLKGILNTGETWTLGDSPLVALTALTDWTYYNRTGSSSFDEVVTPHLKADGSYEQRDEGRKMRVYKSIDTRLMFGDFFAKLRLNFGT